MIEAVGATGLTGQGNLLVLGVDMTGDRSLREYDLESGDAAVIDDPLVFLAQPDSVMVTAEFARRNGLATNSRFPLDTVTGRKEFVVRGILGGGGLSSAFGGNLAVMDIYAAQHVFGRGRRFDRVDVALAPGVSIDEGRRALREALGPGFEVQTPGARGQSFESLLRIYHLMLRFSSVYALVIGLFMIYNAFATAVTQRRSEIGILRALGATRAQVGAALRRRERDRRAGRVGHRRGGGLLAGRRRRSRDRPDARGHAGRQPGRDRRHAGALARRAGAGARHADQRPGGGAARVAGGACRPGEGAAARARPGDGRAREPASDDGGDRAWARPARCSSRERGRCRRSTSATCACWSRPCCSRRCCRCGWCGRCGPCSGGCGPSKACSPPTA